MLPAIGKLTGINSAKIDIVRKKTNINFILGTIDKEGNKYINNVTANTTTIAIYILNFIAKLFSPRKNKN